VPLAHRVKRHPARRRRTPSQAQRWCLERLTTCRRSCLKKSADGVTGSEVINQGDEISAWLSIVLIAISVTVY
jgi:hypothetical protein